MKQARKPEQELGVGCFTLYPQPSVSVLWLARGQMPAIVSWLFVKEARSQCVSLLAASLFQSTSILERWGKKLMSFTQSDTFITFEKLLLFFFSVQ